MKLLQIIALSLLSILNLTSSLYSMDHKSDAKTPLLSGQKHDYSAISIDPDLDSKHDVDSKDHELPAITSGHIQNGTITSHIFPSAYPDPSHTLRSKRPVLGTAKLEERRRLEGSSGPTNYANPISIDIADETNTATTQAMQSMGLATAQNYVVASNTGAPAISASAVQPNTAHAMLAPLVQPTTAYAAQAQSATTPAASASVSIDVKEPEPENPQAIEIDRPATGALPLSQDDLLKLTAGKRYLDCTNLPYDTHGIIADYLCDEWYCAGTYNMQEKIFDCALAPDGSYFLTTLLSNAAVKQWHVDQEKYKSLNQIDPADSSQILQYFAGPSIKFSPDGRYVASSAVAEKKLYLHVKHANGLARLHDIPAEYVQIIQFSPDSRLIAGIDQKGKSIKIWNIKSAKMLHNLVHRNFPVHFENDEVTGIAFHPDNKHIAYTSGQSLHLVPLDPTKKAICARIEPDCMLYAPAFNTDGSLLAAGSLNSFIIWNLKTGKYNHYTLKDAYTEHIEAKDKWVNAIIFTKDAMLLAIHNKIIAIGMNGNYDTSFESVANPGRSCANATNLSLVNNSLIAFSHDGVIKIWKNKAHELKNKVVIPAQTTVNRVIELSALAKYNRWAEANPRKNNALCCAFCSCLGIIAGVSIVLWAIGLGDVIHHGF